MRPLEVHLHSSSSPNELAVHVISMPVVVSGEVLGRDDDDELNENDRMYLPIPVASIHHAASLDPIVMLDFVIVYFWLDELLAMDAWISELGWL